jgi:hypothetical protein
MAIYLIKPIKIFSILVLCFFAILFFEWIIINAVLGCVSIDTSIWQKEGHCFTVQQLIGV